MRPPFSRTSSLTSASGTEKIFAADDDEQVIRFLEAAVTPCFLPLLGVETLGSLRYTSIPSAGPMVYQAAGSPGTFLFLDSRCPLRQPHALSKYCYDPFVESPRFLGVPRADAEGDLSMV